MTTHPEDLNRTQATLADVNHQHGPYWGEYQATRERDGIAHDPDTVPDWYLKRTIVDRLKEARVVVERTELPGNIPFHEASRMRDVWKALGTVAEFLSIAGTAQFGSEAADEALAVLLGGLDAALERERLWDKLRGRADATVEEFSTFDPVIQRKLLAEIQSGT